MTPTESNADYLLLLVEPLWQLFGAIALSIVPAWKLSGLIPVDPLTRLLVAVMGSYTLMYLLEFGAYVLSAPQWVPLSLLLTASAASVVYTLRQRSEPSDAASFPWDGAVTWGALAVWILGMQSRVVVYGGAGWFGDWYEHYERALFFLDQQPPSTRFLNRIWSLAARGPMFNAAAALLMPMFGREFWVYQTLATALNTFPVVALALLIRDMGRIRQPSALLWSAVIFGIAPFAVRQEMYTWTKFFTLGFILGGIHLYRIGLRQDRSWLVGLSFGAFTAGILAHYLVVPYALFFILHYLYFVLRRRWSWRVVGYQALACSALLATWFGYLVTTFGLYATLTANSTFGDAILAAEPSRRPPPWGEVFVFNMVTTLLPYSWRHDVPTIGRVPRVVQTDPRFPEETRPSPSELNRKSEWFEDLARNLSSLLGALGWAGGVGVLTAAVLAIRGWQKEQGRSGLTSSSFEEGPGPEPGWRFWLVFFLVGIPLNILMSSSLEHSGVAHANLAPFICLTAVLLLRWLREAPVTLKVVLIGLFLIESALSTGALLALQERHLPLAFRGESVVISGKLNADVGYVQNYMYKLHQKAVFISDRLGDLIGPFSLILVVISIGLLAALTWISFRASVSGSEKSAPMPSSPMRSP